MALILSGTNGLSDVDGSAATPAIRGTDANTGIFFPAADTIAFAEGGVEAMRLDSSGSLGLGVAPSAWGGTYKALQLQGGSLISPNTSIINIGQNCYYGASGWTYVNTGTANLFQQYDGSYFWLNAASGTAGTGITFSTKMTLDASGNLGLGVTPSNSYTGIKTFEFGANGTLMSESPSSVYNALQLGLNLYYNSAGDTKYKSAGVAATRYVQYQGAHNWDYAPVNSGAAGAALTFTRAMTLDASGRLIVGGTSPATDAQLTISASLEPTLFFQRSDAGNFDAAIQVSSGGAFIFKNGADSSTAAGLTERMRLDGSGNFMVGTTTIPAWGDTTGFGFGYDLPNKTVHFKNNVSTSNALTYFNATSYTSGTGYFAQFRVNGSTVGNITTNGSTTTYATSSDYRLKENIAPMTGALATVAQLKPCTYTWKSDGSASQGFIAHELQAVIPDAVVGEKDEINEDGSIKPQGIDTSFLVATLTAAIQELKAEFDAYKATHP